MLAPLLIFGGALVFLYVSALITGAIRRSRTRANAQTRQSVHVTSKSRPAALSDLVTRGLQEGGASPIGTFDNTTFFRLDGSTEFELQVWPHRHGSEADVTVLTGRCYNRLPRSLAPVGAALEAAMRAISRLDPSATVE